MREFFSENDLISVRAFCFSISLSLSGSSIFFSHQAEVQKVKGDGALSLHTRNLKYGKLENGQFVRVPCGLIKRSKQHFHSLDCGVDMILGNNGFVWITSTPPRASFDSDVSKTVSAEEQEEALKKAAAARVISADDRENICRVRNSILALAEVHVAISRETIMSVYEESFSQGLAAKDLILRPELLQRITHIASGLTTNRY